MTDKRAKADYTVGYGKPPKHGQFKKGASPNPKGRPKGSKNIGTIFREALLEKVLIVEDGKRRKIPKIQAAITQVVNGAAGGDLRAVQALFKILQFAGEFKMPVSEKKTVITMKLPRPLPGEDRSYRDIGEEAETRRIIRED